MTHEQERQVRHFGLSARPDEIYADFLSRLIDEIQSLVNDGAELLDISFDKEDEETNRTIATVYYAHDTDSNYSMSLKEVETPSEDPKSAVKKNSEMVISWIQPQKNLDIYDLHTNVGIDDQGNDSAKTRIYFSRDNSN